MALAREAKRQRRSALAPAVPVASVQAPAVEPTADEPDADEQKDSLLRDYQLHRQMMQLIFFENPRLSAWRHLSTGIALHRAIPAEGQPFVTAACAAGPMAWRMQVERNRRKIMAYDMEKAKGEFDEAVDYYKQLMLGRSISFRSTALKALRARIDAGWPEDIELSTPGTSGVVDWAFIAGASPEQLSNFSRWVPISPGDGISALETPE